MCFCSRNLAILPMGKSGVTVTTLVVMASEAFILHSPLAWLSEATASSLAVSAKPESSL